MGVPTKHIDGDIAIGRNVTTGGDATVAGSATVNKNLRVLGKLEAENVVGHDKGLFNSAEDLRSEYPKPLPGWMARVATDGASRIYAEEDGAWVDTGIAESVDTTALLSRMADVETTVNEIKENTANPPTENKSGIVDFDVAVGETSGALISLKYTDSTGRLFSEIKTIPAASPERAGIMTSEQARDLQTLVRHGDVFDEMWAWAVGSDGDVVDPGETYALNTVRDLTRADAMRILAMPNFIVMNGAMCVNHSIRTNLPVGPGNGFTALGGRMIDLSCIAAHNVTIEDLFLWKSDSINYVSGMAGAFMGASTLRNITGMINVENCTDFTDAFKGCFALERVSIDGLKVSLDLSDCPRISYASLWGIVENAVNTEQIEIKLDASLYNDITDVGTIRPDGWTCNGGTAGQWREFFATCDSQHINIVI